MTPTSSSPQPPPPPPAPWRNLFLSHLQTMEEPEFTLSTLRRATAIESSSGISSNRRRSSVLGGPPPYVPRTRICICRGLWASLPLHPQNEAPRNPPGVYESDLLTFTTDARMDKMAELWEDGGIVDFLDARNGHGHGHGHGHGDPGSPTTTKVGEELWEEGLARMKGKKKFAGDDAVARGLRGSGAENMVVNATGDERFKGSGGGAVVEAVFWARGPRVQWRVRGRAYVLAPDIESSPAGREVMALLKSRMRRLSSSSSSSSSNPPSPSPPLSSSSPEGKDQEKEEKDKWSFSREITAHFGNLSPLMRGSFRNPPPGRPVTLPVENEGLGLGQRVMDLQDPIARANFRVVVIVPEEVDQVDLSDREHGRRWIHTYVGGTGQGQGKEWETVEVWP